MVDHSDSAGPQGWDLVVDALKASKAPGTQAVYASHWKHWREWCARNDAPDLPTTPEHLAGYLAQRAQYHAMSTVRTAAAAISAYHTQAGCEDPAQHRDVRMTLSGLARQHRGSARSVTGLTAIRLAAIAATAHIPRYREGAAEAQLRGLTDRAMTGLMRDCLLRRSEAADLTWDDLEDQGGRLPAYSPFATPRQTRQGAGAVVVCVTFRPWRWLMEMKDQAEDREAVMGLCPHQIGRRIVSAAAAAGLRGRYGGHSPRIGMAEDLGEAGVELPSLMQVGRWKSPTMPAHYIRNISAGRNAVANWYARRGE